MSTRHRKFRRLAAFITPIIGFVLAPIFSVAFAQEPAKISDVLLIIKNIISLLAPAAAIAFLVMLIFGGFKFVTSGGDPKQTASARSTLTYAIIGILLVIGAWLILLLVKGLTGVDTTNVSLPF